MPGAGEGVAPGDLGRGQREEVAVGERRGFWVIKKNLTCGSYGWVVGTGDGILRMMGAAKLERKVRILMIGTEYFF